MNIRIGFFICLIRRVSDNSVFLWDFKLYRLDNLSLRDCNGLMPAHDEIIAPV